jgi:hypothetical protein
LYVVQSCEGFGRPHDAPAQRQRFVALRRLATGLAQQRPARGHGSQYGWKEHGAVKREIWTLNLKFEI